MKSLLKSTRLLLVACISSTILASTATADHPADQGQDPSRGHSPRQVESQLKVREGFSVSLVAAEPNVVDPVSASWSSDGRLWVVEMSDCPMPRPGQTNRHGRIRVLSERDASGQFQKSVTFADGLDFATGVLPWRDGAIVTLAGQIIFLRDVDGDGRSDEQEVGSKGSRSTTGNSAPTTRRSVPTVGYTSPVDFAVGRSKQWIGDSKRERKQSY